MSSTATKPADFPLLAVHRCDRCGAQAYVRVTLVSGLELLFCAHDYAIHEEQLSSDGAHVHDERHRLAPANP